MKIGKVCPSCRKSFEVEERYAATKIYCRPGCQRTTGLNVQEPLVREYFLERDNFQCTQCKVTAEMSGRALELHHIIPLVKGGSKDDPDNVTVLCYLCHQEKHGICGGSPG